MKECRRGSRGPGARGPGGQADAGPARPAAHPGTRRSLTSRPPESRYTLKWGQLEVFMTQWRRIEALTAEPGPFITRVSRTAMTAIALD
jgi:hypothetical protein